MLIFVGDLPKGATEQDLWQLGRVADGAGRVRIFKKPGSDGHMLRYGLLQVESDTAARRVMDRLRLARLEGGSLRVRPFVDRHASANERRAIDWRARPWTGPERRQGERRSFH
ncbi:MAG: RNA-binding protein [Gammaproteobacteria bacterium]